MLRSPLASVFMLPTETAFVSQCEGCIIGLCAISGSCFPTHVRVILLGRESPPASTKNPKGTIPDSAGQHEWKRMPRRRIGG